MSDYAKSFSSFELTADQSNVLLTDFTRLIQDTDLTHCSRVADIITEYKKVSGIYFWVMRHDDHLFRIYIGKTKCIFNRMRNYFGEFQPHSPNDFKLRIFRTFLAEKIPDATLDLYFLQKTAFELTQAENQALATFNPLLNRRQHVTADARTALRDAFSTYYRSAFEQLLKNGS